MTDCNISLSKHYIKKNVFTCVLKKLHNVFTVYTYSYVKCTSLNSIHFFDYIQQQIINIINTNQYNCTFTAAKKVLIMMCSFSERNTLLNLCLQCFIQNYFKSYHILVPHKVYSKSKRTYL